MKRKRNTVQFSTHGLIGFVKNFINKAEIWLKSVKSGSITRKEEENFSPIFQYNFWRWKICNTSRAMAFFKYVFFGFFSVSLQFHRIIFGVYTAHSISTFHYSMPTNELIMCKIYVYRFGCQKKTLFTHCMISALFLSLLLLFDIVELHFFVCFRICVKLTSMNRL